MKAIVAVITLVVACAQATQPARLNMRFEPESEKFLDAAKEYESIWRSEGKKMIEALESVSGLTFYEREVKVIVCECVSRAGMLGAPMRLRASYTADVKKATILHELGHRLNEQIVERPEQVDEHRLLFLYLYEVWAMLYGKEFADAQVEVERDRWKRAQATGNQSAYNYDAAWTWALSMNAEKRAAMLKEILRRNRIKK